jgi:hypothetical protein
MFNSIALDTVIGLIFVFLLYSLLATILGELVANWLGLRARMLRQAIERLLNDVYKGDLEKNKLKLTIRSIGSFLLYEYKEFNDSIACRFYQQPSIKYLTKGHNKAFAFLKKGKPSYIRTENFSDTLIQMCKGKGFGATEMQKIGFCLKFNTLHIQPETLGHLTNLFTDSGEDLEKFKQKLNEWYNEMMERLGGWFKRKIQLILFLIGLIIAFAFNVDSIAIAKKLAKDKNAREQMVQMAIHASDSTSSISKALEQSQDSTVKDSLLRESYRQVKQATDDAGKVLGLGWDFPKSTTTYGKICYIFTQPFRHPLILLGFIITALAISLGSNFWFDLLKKLVSIRGSGVNPDEIKTGTKKETFASSPDGGTDLSLPGVRIKTGPISPQKPEDPLDVALRIYGEEIKKEKGVVDIGKGYSQSDEGAVVLNRLQVNVIDEDTAVRIRSKFNSLRISENEFIEVVVFITGKPKTLSGPDSNAANTDKGIANEHKLFGWGSFGCLVRNKYQPSQKYILSCYHVMNGDYTWKNDGANRKIQNPTAVISDTYQGFLNNALDIAYAEIKDEVIFDFYKNKINQIKPKGIREISINDVYTCQVVIEGLTTKKSTGLIVNDSKQMSFEYSSGPKQYFSHQIDDLFIISHKVPEYPAFIGTSNGDSGSVVLDNEGNALGIVVGSDLIHTYAIKIKTIFDLLGLELEV